MARDEDKKDSIRVLLYSKLQEPRYFTDLEPNPKNESGHPKPNSGPTLKIKAVKLCREAVNDEKRHQQH